MFGYFHYNHETATCFDIVETSKSSCQQLLSAISGILSVVHIYIVRTLSIDVITLHLADACGRKDLYAILFELVKYKHFDLSLFESFSFTGARTRENIFEVDPIKCYHDLS